jgi:hypothetical protein
VLKTQRQGWRNRSSDDKRESKSFHLKLLQEAVSIVYVNQRFETKETGAEKDIAVSLLAKLLHQQEIDAETLLAAKDQVDMQHSMGVGWGVWCGDIIDYVVKPLIFSPNISLDFR